MNIRVPTDEHQRLIDACNELLTVARGAVLSPVLGAAVRGVEDALQGTLFEDAYLRHREATMDLERRRLHSKDDDYIRLTPFHQIYGAPERIAIGHV